jgi:hypothetical protein
MLTNKVRLCERSEPQSEPFVGQARVVKPGLYCIENIDLGMGWIQAEFHRNPGRLMCINCLKWQVISKFGRWGAFSPIFGHTTPFLLSPEIFSPTISMNTISIPRSGIGPALNRMR